MHRVVIVGGGFGGVETARRLQDTPVQVTLLDRENHYLFQPLLYQVATGSLSPANIATPLRAIFRNRENIEVLLAEATDVDPAKRLVITADRLLEYDTLVLAAGSKASYFAHPEWEQLAPGLKTIDDATNIRRRLLLAFEAAELETDELRRRAHLTFVLVGGGPTGVELAGTIADLASHTLRGNFRTFDPATTRVLIIEAGPRLLAAYPPDLSQRATEALARLGVTVWTGASVADVTERSVTVKFAERDEVVPTSNVFWTAGVQAAPLGRRLAEKLGVEPDRAGRIPVAADLTLPGHPEIFVIGDMATFTHTDDGKPLPGIAPVAIQQGRHVAESVLARTRGEQATAFRYHHRGDMATVGRGVAIADIKGWHFAGYFAWCMWLFIHLMNIVQVQNRVLVLVQWAYSYVTRNRAARLITGPPPFPLTENPVGAAYQAAAPSERPPTAAAEYTRA